MSNRESKSSDWVEILREQCQTRSQKQVGLVIGYTTAVVNQVLKGTYKGNLNRVESSVKGAFMNESVDCPVVGDIPTHICLNYQKRPFTSINPQYVQIYKACRNGCKHSTL